MTRPAIYRQDAFTLRNLARFLEDFAEGSGPIDGFTPAMALREAGAWAGKTYAKGAYAEAARDMEAALRWAEQAPDMPASVVRERLGRGRR